MEENQELAERNHEVRCAARAWHRARIVYENALERIHELYPDDRARVGPVFRVLLFLFAVVAAVSAVVLLALFELPTGLLLVLAACGSILATEVQIGSYRRAGSGAEEATALLSAIFVAVAYGYFLSECGVDDSFAWRTSFAVLALASTAAVFRWGVAALGALAAASAFVALSWWSGARIAWILLALVLVALLLRGSTSKHLAPSHRRACDFALVVALLALYVALHLGSYDIALLETELLSGFQREAPGSAMRAFFVMATAVMPALLLFGGIRGRRPILLRSGIVFAVASLVTLRFYVHVAPLWVVLTVSGGIAVALAMLVNRLLSGGPGKERHGFTAEPVFERLSPAMALEVGMAAVLAPAPVEKSDEAPFRGGGGEFGGGGASGSY